MENSIGPCLDHCYKTSKFEYITIGIIIGIILHYIYQKQFNKKTIKN